MKEDFGNTLAKKILRGSSVIIFFTILSSPIGYFIRMMYSRVLTVEDYGLIYAVLSFFSLLTMINDIGFGFAVSYFIPKFKNVKDYESCWLIYKYDQFIEVFTSIFIGILIFVFRDFLVNNFFKNPDAENLLFILIIYLITNGIVSSMQKLFIGLQAIFYYSSIEFFRLFFTFIFSLFLFLYNYKNVYLYALAFVGGYILVALLFSILIRVKFKYLIHVLVLNKQLLNKALHYAIPTFFTASLQIMMSYSDVMFLTLFRNIETVAIFNIVFPILSIITIISDPLLRLILPLVSEVSERNINDVRMLTNKIIDILPFVGLYFAIFLFLFPRSIILTLFSYKWVEASSLALQLGAIVYFPALLNSYLMAVVNGLGEVKNRMNLSIITFTVSMITGSIGAYYLGLYGVIISNGIVFITSLSGSYIILKRRIGLVVDINIFFKTLLLIFLAVLFNHYNSYVPSTLIEILIVGIVYTGIIASIYYFFGVINKKMLSYFFALYIKGESKV